MKLGYIGLGKMGCNMVERLGEKGHEVFAFDANEDARKAAKESGIKIVDSILNLFAKLAAPRVIWIMVPYTAVDDVLNELVPHLASEDTVIDGGNSPYKESIRRASGFESTGINFMDAGVSGGPRGAREGACLMVGGDRKDFDALEPLFRDLAAENGYGYMGTHGSGHFVKMVHNGIEYGMMQSIAEGFALMRSSPYSLDLQKIADLFNHGSVIESRLVGWLKEGFLEFGQDMKRVRGSVEQTGEGQWAVETAKDLKVPVPVIKAALQFRVKSKKNPSYTGKLLSVMRNRFGGHEINMV